MERSHSNASVQTRVARFGKWIGAISVTGLAVRATAHLLLGNSPETFLSLAWGAHLSACFFVLAMWGALRGAERSRRTVEWLEAGALFGAAISYQIVGTYLEPEARPDYVVLLAMNVMFVGRAAFIPSSPARTFAVTAAVGVPMLGLVYYNLASAPPDPSIPDHAPVTRTFNAAVWWSFITMLCVIITRTIYGLREEVRVARRLGQYQLEELIASGGMGEVYSARHAMLRRPTAVKLIRPEVVGEHTVARFEREAKLTAALSHPNTVTVYDYGRTDEGVFYYAMELLDGADLQTIVEVTGPMPQARVARILAQVAGALAEAHAAGLIHRDVKPGNILLVDRGGSADVAKVVDFGLVKELDERALNVTDAGKILGTPLYVSPEGVAAPDSVDERSDLYAIGAVGYFLLTGKPPFEGGSAIEVYTKHLDAEPVPPSERLGTPIDEGLERVLLECLAKQPGDRPGSARELAVRLLDVVDRLPAWDDYDARQWWKAHGPSLKERRTRQRASGPLTVAR